MGKANKQNLVSLYLEYCTFERRFTPKTIEGKKEALHLFFDIFNGEVTLESYRSFSVWLTKRGCSQNSVRHYQSIMKSFLRFLVSVERAKDFSARVLLPKKIRPTHDLIPVEVAEQIILAGTDTARSGNVQRREKRLALRFLLRTGLRLGELTRLKSQDLNFLDKTIKIHSLKNGNVDFIPLPADLEIELKTHSQGKDQLFSQGRDALNKALKAGAKKMGVKTSVHVHLLRHIFCTTLLKNGVPLQIVSRLMRHSSVAITDQVYSHYLVDDLKVWLNSSHPLIRGGLSSNDLFSLISDNVKKLVSDDRFTLTTASSKNSLLIEIKAV